MSLNCSYDSKYLVIGLMNGYLEIFDIKKQCFTKIIERPMLQYFSVAITKDNQYAYLTDMEGQIAKITLDKNIDDLQEFDPYFSRHHITFLQINCLTKNQKYLIFSFLNFQLIRVHKFKTKETKTLNMQSLVKGMCLIENDDKLAIALTKGRIVVVNIENF